MLDTYTPPIVNDPEFPAAAELLGEPGRDLVTTVLGDEGGTVGSLRNDFVLYTPGRGMTLTYAGQVAWSDGSLGDEIIVAFARRNHTLPPDVRTAELAGSEVGIWRYPNDPYLPGLTTAADPVQMARVLQDLGFPKGKLTLSLRAYRPGVRAVIQATISRPTLLYHAHTRRFEEATHQHIVYLKVLRPGEADELAARHDALAELLPAPRCLAHHDDLAIVVLEAVPGSTLGTWLSRAPSSRFPSPDALVALLDRLASTSSEGYPRDTVADQVKHHVRLLHALVPEEDERIERVGAELASSPRGELITIHGDFYDSQVLIRDGQIAGLLDLDDVGPGERLDDLATMAGRIWTIAQSEAHPESRAEITGYALDLLDVFSGFVDPVELDRRVGGILLGRATGPFRVQEPGWREECVRRIRIAEQWLSHPREPREMM